MESIATGSPPTLSISRPLYYPALTGIRAVAAFLVFLTHFNPFKEEQKWPFTFVHQGHFGVPIFFVLSGFLIATRYMSRVEPTWHWARKYMQNRVARIYPLYFLLTALTFIVFEFNSSYDALGIWSTYKPVDKMLVAILNFTFLRGFFANYFFTGVSQGWSLTAEETFYVLAPCIFLTLGGKMRRLILWAVLLLATGLILVGMFSHFAVALRGFFGSTEFMFQWTFFGHSLEFIAGIALAMFVSKQGNISKKGSWATYTGVVWIIACAAFVATMETLQVSMTPEHLKILTINFLLPTGICLMFYGLLRENTIVRRVLETRTFDLLGKSSYAFYLLHLGILSVALHKLDSPVLVSLLITILLSIALFKLIEEPLHKRLRAKSHNV